MGPTELVTNHHQSDGGDCGICCTGVFPALQLILRVSGAQGKFTKDENMVESKR
jgi:hypothetical protein